MSQSIRAILTIALGVGLASVVACSSNSSPRSPSTPLPIAKSPSGQYVGRGAASNMAPDPDSLARWIPGQFSLGNGGPGRAADLEATGTGKSGHSYDLFSPIVTVQSSKTYTFSLWIDPSHITSGRGVLGIYSPSRMVAYAQVQIVPGPPGRYRVTARIPDGITQIRLDFQPNALTIDKGKKLKVSQPMLQPTQDETKD